MSFLILSLFLAADSAAASGNTKEANIFYLDHDYRISFVLADGMEKAARSTDTFKIESVATELAYTDGRRFVLEKPQDLTLEELNATTAYLTVGEATATLGDRSFLLAPQTLPAGIGALIAGSMPPYFKTEQIRVKFLSGVTPGGRFFKVVELPGRRSESRWSRTLAMNYHVLYNGEKMVFTEACFPFGLAGFSRYVEEQVRLKDNNLLLGLGLGGDLMMSVVQDPPAKMVARFERLGTGIISLRAEDIKYLWQWYAGKEFSPPAGGMQFLCSNIETSDPGFAKLIKPYVLKTLDGVRVAFISLIPAASAQMADLTGVPIKVKDPFESGFLPDLLEELKTGQKADLVVAVSNLQDTELGRLLVTVGIDIVIGPKSWEKAGTRSEDVVLDGWNTGIHGSPAAFIVRDSRGLGRLNLIFGADGGLKTVRKRSMDLSSDDILPDADNERFKEKIIQHFLGSSEVLLPDMRRLSAGSDDPRTQYGILDFSNIVVSLLKRDSGAEIAFMRIRPTRSNILGDVSSSMVKVWLGRDDKLVKAWVPGSLIKALMPKFEFKSSGGAEYRKYDGADYFAVSGLEPDGRISGLPVRNNELYLAVFPAALLGETDKYPQIKNVRVVDHGQRTLNEVVLSQLEKEKAAADKNGSWEASIGRLMENKPVRNPQWRLNVRDLSLQMSDTGVRHTENFTQVSDSRLRTTGQKYIQGSGKIFSEFYSGSMRFDSGLTLDYGKMTLRPRHQLRVETESVDQIMVESEFKYYFQEYNNGVLGRMVLGPFVNLAYDTEFTRQSALPKRKIVRGRAGLKLFEGAYVRELYTGLVTEQEYTYEPARTKYAAEAGFGVNMLLPGTALTLVADGNYRNFARSRFDTAADLKQRLELNMKFSTKLYGDVMISPFFNFFLATGKKASGTATNIMTGVSLNYSRLFKLKY